MKNVAILLGAFAIGHGSVFLAQTLLLQADNSQRVADFGVTFSFFVFAIFIIETSTIQVLARICANKVGDLRLVSEKLLYVIVFRLCVAVVYIAVVETISRVLGNEFLNGFFSLAYASFIIICLHPSGILDGMGKVGINGIILAGQNIAISIVLYSTAEMDSGLSGELLGLVVVVYYAITMILSHCYLTSRGLRYPIFELNWRGFSLIAKELLLMLVAVGPGQVLQRIQMAVGLMYLTTDVMAAYVYVRQGLSVVSQSLGFVRRVEFPHLVLRVKDVVGLGIALSSLAKQKYSIILAFSAFIFIQVILWFPLDRLSGSFDEVVKIAMIASFLIITESLSSSLMTGLIAKGYTSLVARIRLFVVSGVSVLVYFSVSDYGLQGLLIPEITGQVLICLLGVLALLNRDYRSNNA